MSTKQLLLGIFGVGLFVVGMISLLYAAYTMYYGKVCAPSQPAAVAQPVKPSASPSASPSATISPTTAVKKIILVTPTPVRRVVTQPVVSPSISPAQ